MGQSDLSPTWGYLPGFGTDCQRSSRQRCLDQWFSKRGPGPAASATPGNLLEMHILGPAQTCPIGNWGRGPAVRVLTAPLADFDAKVIQPPSLEATR